MATATTLQPSRREPLHEHPLVARRTDALHCARQSRTHRQTSVRRNRDHDVRQPTPRHDAVPGGNRRRYFKLPSSLVHAGSTYLTSTPAAARFTLHRITDLVSSGRSTGLRRSAPYERSHALSDRKSRFSRTTERPDRRARSTTAFATRQTASDPARSARRTAPATRPSGATSTTAR